MQISLGWANFFGMLVFGLECGLEFQYSPLGFHKDLICWYLTLHNTRDGCLGVPFSLIESVDSTLDTSFIKWKTVPIMADILNMIPMDQIRPLGLDLGKNTIMPLNVMWSDHTWFSRLNYLIHMWHMR